MLRQIMGKRKQGGGGDARGAAVISEEAKQEEKETKRGWSYERMRWQAATA